MGLPLAFLLSFAAPDIDVAWRTSLAHRMEELPNPYASLPPSVPGSLIAPELEMPEPKRPPRSFAIEDSADMMGLPVSRNVLLGFQVEFVGPGDEPPGTAKTTRVARDPYHPTFLLPTAGVRIGFWPGFISGSGSARLQGMTFRPAARDRLIYPVAIFAANAGIYLTLKFLTTMELAVALALSLIMLGCLLIWAIMTSIQVWRSRIIVDQIGVHWQGGPLKMGSLDWPNIKAVSYDERHSTMTPGSLEDAAGQRYPLPFLHDELIRNIEEHLGRSPRGR